VRRTSLFLALLAWAWSPLEARRPTDPAVEARAVATALLTHLAGYGLVCIRAEIASPAFAADAELAAISGDSGNDKAAPLSARLALWADPAGHPLPAAEQEKLAQVASTVATQGPHPLLLRGIERPWVPAGIAIAAASTPCRFSLGGPAVADSWAFIEINSTTAGHMFALRRGPHGWAVVGQRMTWLS
jgi:hypothetical protein